MDIPSPHLAKFGDHASVFEPTKSKPRHLEMTLAVVTDNRKHGMQAKLEKDTSPFLS